MAADVGCLACMANEIKPKGIYNILMNPRAWKRARDLRADTFSGSESISTKTDEISERLRSIIDDINQLSLHAPDSRTRGGIRKANKCVSDLLSMTAQMKFYKMIAHDWQAPDLNDAYQSGIKEYDLGQH